MDKVEFSIKIKTALTESGKTRAVVAEQIDISLRTLDNWCAGTSLPDIEQLQKYAAITCKKVPWFFDIKLNEGELVQELREQIKKIESERDDWREQARFLKGLLEGKK